MKKYSIFLKIKYQQVLLLLMNFAIVKLEPVIYVIAFLMAYSVSCKALAELMEHQVRYSTVAPHGFLVPGQD
jgi:hypothetical protein